jgi:hypothetical protein
MVAMQKETVSVEEHLDILQYIDKYVNMWDLFLLGETSRARYKIVRFQVLTAASMKLRIFWDVLPCS